MKKILVSFALLLCVSYSALADNDRPVSVDALPREIKDFVSTHFEGKTISYATREWNSHEIYLEGGIKIEFEGYQWDEIGGYNLPDNILKLLWRVAKEAKKYKWLLLFGALCTGKVWI